MAKKCKKNPICLDSKCVERNKGNCRCNTWFPVDDLAANTCMDAVLVVVDKNGKQFFATKEEYLDYIGGEAQFINDFGYDPITGNNTGIESSSRYQAIAKENAKKEKQRKIIIYAAIGIAVVGTIIIWRLFK